MSKDIKNIVKASWKPENAKIIKTNIYPIDKILCGGLELGSIVQFVGESGVGKSTIALDICKELCKQDYNVAYVDSENSISKEILETTDTIRYVHDEQLFIIKESSFNEVEKILDDIILTGEFRFIVIDSLAGLINNCYTNIKEKVQSVTNKNSNFEARPISLFVNKYSALASKYNICFIFLNQFRNKINIHNKSNPTLPKEYGAKIVRYNSDNLIKIASNKNKKDSDSSDSLVDLENSESSVEESTKEYLPLTLSVIKSNKLPPEYSVKCWLQYGRGISRVRAKIIEQLDSGIITFSNGYYYLIVEGENKKFRGIEALEDFMTNSDGLDEMEDGDDFIVDSILGGISD